MISTETTIRIIRDQLSRIGIGEKKLNDAAVLIVYSINPFGNPCPVPGISGNPSGSLAWR
jgi:hypothetical protein